ncbi:Spy/CpxP family protein refolding chaperone [Legionella jordanis]|uniref:16 kD immunogenic protein n=1 Tax=Legionella jordanis TaxID=456 RepID=A0A0W0VA48_9GAMM|nr:Spy/CpxP family protein refolding chaperone [Legionella jordanis]KTD17009.1 16 kD immunogenic protein [Legionella jordanis]RMX03149.1 periplasmic heavy metal sensor [Legionella jordanis]VEH12795.1 16 kD immunogenic protein [Legionella jordanis]
MKKISLAAVVLSFVMGQVAFATSSDTTTSSSTTGSTPDQTMTTSTSSNPSDQMGSHCGCGNHMKQMLSALNLDSSQQTKVQAIKSQLMQTLQANREQMKSIRSQIRDLVTSDTLDDAKLNSLVDQKKELIAQMMKAKVTAKQQVYSLLNDQQKAQFKQMLQQWEQDRENHKC